MSPGAAGRAVLREAEVADRPALWALLGPVYREGTTYAVARDVDEETAVDAWTDHQRVLVAVVDGAVVGSYYLGPNLPGPGVHVANAGFVVSAAARGSGLGRSLGEHALRTARQEGFAAMQFNCVVASNPAVALWRSLGFAEVGRVPGAYEHPDLGRVDTLVMHRWL